MVRSALVFLSIMLAGLSLNCKTQTQKDIDKYSQVIYKTYRPYKKMAALFQSWNKIGQKKDFDKYRSHLKQKIMPKLEQYHKTVEKIKSENAELNSIHAIMVKSIKSLLDGLTALEKDLDKANWNARVAELQKKIKESKQLEADYQTQIRAFYTKNGITKIGTP